MMRAISDQVEKNPEYLSILEKETIKNGKIDDDVQVEQVSVMNKLLNDALRAKGYAGPDIKMILTDVRDPNGPYYTDTLTNVVVFDRNMLANSNRDEILNALGHEFVHYSKEDDIDKSQDIANHTGKLLEDRTKGMVSKEATEETLVAIRNNKNVITGEEGKKLAESIPEDRREYDIYVYERDLNIPFLGKFAMHSFIVSDPKEQNRIYTDEALKNPNIVGEDALRDEFKNIGMPESRLINGRRIFSLGGFAGEKEKDEPEGKLVPRENYEDDIEVYKKDNGISPNSKLTGEIITIIDLPPEEETEFIKRMIKVYNNYKNNENYPNYSIRPKVIVKYQKGTFIVPPIGFNCNSWSSGLMKNSGETDNPLNNSKSMRIDWGKNFLVPDKYFKGGK